MSASTFRSRRRICARRSSASATALASTSPQHLSRGLLIAIGLAAVLVAALGLRAFAGVVAPVFLALVLSITVQPLRRLPARHGLPAWIGVVLSLVAAVLATVIEAVVHLPAALILIPVVVVGFALSWHASGREDVERRGRPLGRHQPGSDSGLPGDGSERGTRLLPVGNRPRRR